MTAAASPRNKPTSFKMFQQKRTNFQLCCMAVTSILCISILLIYSMISGPLPTMISLHGIVVKLSPSYHRHYSHGEMTDVILGRKTGDLYRNHKDNHKLDSYRMPKYSWIIKNQGFCAQFGNLSFLLAIYTAPGHSENRDILRKSWTNSSYYHSFRFATVFLLAKSKTQQIQDKIRAEQQKYGDIVQADFIDNYQNLSYKGIMMLAWVRDYCQNAPYVVKADDDVYLDVPQLINLFKLISNNQTNIKGRVLIGKVYLGATINKDSTQHWGAPKDTFPNTKSYPTYMCGWSYIISSDLVRELHDAASLGPVFFIDDVYMTGIVPGQVAKLDILHYTMTTGWRSSKLGAPFVCKTDFMCEIQMDKILTTWCDQMRNISENPEHQRWFGTRTSKRIENC